MACRAFTGESFHGPRLATGLTKGRDRNYLDRQSSMRIPRCKLLESSTEQQWFNTTKCTCLHYYFFDFSLTMLSLNLAHLLEQSQQQ
jgi:hypothetical protein